MDLSSTHWTLTAFTVILESNVSVGFASRPSHLAVAGVVASVAGAQRPRAFVVSVIWARGWAFTVVGPAIGSGPAERAGTASDPLTRVRYVWVKIGTRVGETFRNSLIRPYSYSWESGLL